MEDIAHMHEEVDNEYIHTFITFTENILILFYGDFNIVHMASVFIIFSELSNYRNRINRRPI